MRYSTTTAAVWVCFLCSGAGVFAACPDRDTMFGTREVYNLPSDNPFEGAKAHVLCTGDYNADGFLDAAVVSRLSPELSVLFGNGDGTFDAAVPYDLPSDASSLYEGGCQGDLDNDGDIDLVGVDFFGSQLAVTLNDGNGVFGAPVMYSTGAGTWPHGAHAIDFDGDGDRDLIITYDYVSGSPNGAAAFWRNDGTGAFSFVRSTPTQGMRPQNVGIGDFDGDGDLDWAAANSEWTGGASNPNVAVFRNDGTGVMSFVHKISTPITSAPCSCHVDDLDKDGALDLIVGSWTDESLCVLWGDGQGRFSAAQVLTGPPTSTAVEPVAADIDQDGALDIVVSLYEPTSFGKYSVEIFWGDGSRGFTAGPLLAAGVKPRFPAVADFDRDGDLDIASIQWEQGTFEVFENKCALGTLFTRGDPNGKGIDISDAVTILAYLFASKPGPECLDVIDINDDGGVNIADAVTLLGYLFASKPAPPAPFAECGLDPTDDTLACDAWAGCP